MYHILSRSIAILAHRDREQARPIVPMHVHAAQHSRFLPRMEWVLLTPW